MSSPSIKTLIEFKKGMIRDINADLARHTEHMGYIVSVLEQEIYELGIKSQMDEVYEVENKGWCSRQRRSVPVEVPVATYTSDGMLKALTDAPLIATTDALKLKELQERFPGAVITRLTDEGPLTVSYKHVGEAYIDSTSDMIYCKETMHTFADFSEFGEYQRFKILADWHGHSINLSHFF